MKTGKRFWLQRGFIPAEASAFKNITTEAIKDSRYIRTMINTRMKFRSEAARQKLTIREYYRSIREWYVKRGFTDNQADLLLRGRAQQRNKARRIAFDFFNAYKEKYAVRDTSGKLIETPRKKTRTKRRPITGKHNIDQIIRKHQDEIKYKQFQLKFETSPYMRGVYQETIKHHREAIVRLREQMK